MAIASAITPIKHKKIPIASNLSGRVEWTINIKPDRPMNRPTNPNGVSVSLKNSSSDSSGNIEPEVLEGQTEIGGVKIETFKKWELAAHCQEDAAANSVASGGVSMPADAMGKKAQKKRLKPQYDGRTRAGRKFVERMNLRKAAREAKKAAAAQKE